MKVVLENEELIMTADSHLEESYLKHFFAKKMKARVLRKDGKAVGIKIFSATKFVVVPEEFLAGREPVESRPVTEEELAHARETEQHPPIEQLYEEELGEETGVTLAEEPIVELGDIDNDLELPDLVDEDFDFGDLDEVE